MEGAKPAATTVANCIGAITNIPRIVQDFYMAGLPVWLLQPSTDWDHPVRCNVLEVVAPLNPANVVCVSEHYPPFPTIFYGSVTDIKKHGAIYAHSRKWLVFKDPFAGSKGKSIHLWHNSLSYYFQRHNIFNYSIGFNQSIHLNQSIRLNQSIHFYYSIC